jgi:hypothetical protein
MYSGVVGWPFSLTVIVEGAIRAARSCSHTRASAHEDIAYDGKSPHRPGRTRPTI